MTLARAPRVTSVPRVTSPPAPISESDLRTSLYEAGYRVQRLLGAGGMGTVYAAEQVSVGRAVAVKTLHRHLANDEAFVRRFLREGRITALLRSPHVVHAFDAGRTRAGIPFLVLELLEGETFAERLAASGPLSPSAAVTAAIAVSEALVEAHQLGVLHRDVKPSNVFATRAGRDGRDGRDGVKLLDFGVAKLDEGSCHPAMTTQNVCVGSFSFMAPEQAIDPRAVDARADVFGLGATLHTLITGLRPFGVRRNPAVYERARPSLACEALEAVVARCVAWAPQDRYPTMLAVHAALRAL